VVPTLWSNIEAMIEVGMIRCVDVVKDELASKDDETYRWARAQRGLFAPLEQDVQLSVRRVLDEHPRLINVGSGRSGADPFVIGLAMARTASAVVTEETAANSRARPRIPDVCASLGVRCLRLVEFVEEQGWVFR
jgi:hypothetical protein